ncbi:MAG: adenosylcobinamide amidohydrolase [Anaerobacillus sp.]|uniref:adenosylcobinamide amidohydrolase n=1 Tax=Anaerobacillus sp. TaxID=1872506 RepID=UPI00391A28B3
MKEKQVDDDKNILQNLKITQSIEMIIVESPVLLKTLSSAIIGAGFNWVRTFVNRHVDKEYNYDDAEAEFKTYLSAKKIDFTETVGMMTAAKLEDVSFIQKNEKEFSVFVVVTAGLSNAVDASRSYYQNERRKTVGTINTWIFIKGNLTEAAFVQAMMTATEAKVKALQDEEVRDPVMKTIATGTSTDSMMIAGTQTGTEFNYAGTITSLGKTIGLAVYEATLDAIRSNRKRGVGQ